MILGVAQIIFNIFSIFKTRGSKLKFYTKKNKVTQKCSYLMFSKSSNHQIKWHITWIHQTGRPRATIPIKIHNPFEPLAMPKILHPPFLSMKIWSKKPQSNNLSEIQMPEKTFILNSSPYIGTRNPILQGQIFHLFVENTKSESHSTNLLLVLKRVNAKKKKNVLKFGWLWI